MAEYKIVGVCYNKYETDLAARIKNTIDEWEIEKTIEQTWYIADDDNPDMETFKRVQGAVREWTKEQFSSADVIIYVAPVVRVVRYIGKLLEDQASDPAVIAVDSNGKYCIPVLSGRRGEGYEIARLMDAQLGIRFINATTPEEAKEFDIVKYAESNDLILSNTDYAREVSTAIHAGDEVGFYTNYPVMGNLPGGMTWQTEGDLGVYISPSYHSAYFAHTLWLIPRCITVAIRCKEPASYRQIERFILDTMKAYSLYPEAIREIAMIADSESEGELRRFALEYNADFKIASTAFARQCLETQTEENGVNEEAAEKCGGGKVIVTAVEREQMNCSIAMKNVYIRF